MDFRRFFFSSSRVAKFTQCFGNMSKCYCFWILVIVLTQQTRNLFLYAKGLRTSCICIFAYLHLNLIISGLYISTHLQRSTNYADNSKAILAEKIEGFSLTYFQNYVKILSNSKKGLMGPKENIWLLQKKCFKIGII